MTVEKIVIAVSLGFIMLGLLLAFIRFLLGPQPSDRVVAADTMSVTFVAGLILLGYYFNRFIYVDISLIYAALGFIGVLVIARYLEGGL